MKFRAFLAASALGAGLLLALPAPATAQFWGAPGAMGEDRLLASLHQRGFRRMSPPVLNRDVFVLDAIDPNGRPVRLIVSAFNGRIVDAHPQRPGRWQPVDPRWGDDDRFAGRVERWRRHSEAEDWGDERWDDRQAYRNDRRGSRIEIDPETQDWDDSERETPRQRSRTPEASRNPERLTVPPPPAATTPRDPDLPAPTLKNPTIVKRSPTAIPRDPGEKVDVAPKPPAQPTPPSASKPGQGTKDNPRVIDMTPKTPIAASPGAALPSTTARKTAPPTGGAGVTAPSANSATPAPAVPPAPLE